MNPRALHAVLLALLIAAVSTTGRWKPPATSFGYEEFRVLPLRIHLLRSEQFPELQCGLSDEDVTRIVDKVNLIWAQAGIQFYRESVRREPANEAHALDMVGRRLETMLLALRPADSLAEPMFHVYYIHRFSVNGISLGHDTAFVQDSASLREVDGGIDEPLPRVTAHELGHALGLPHRQDRVNLMASGTTGVSLNDAEIARARKTALALPWAEAPAAALERAQRADDAQTAALLRCLAQIPGHSPTRDAAATRLKSGS